MYLRIDFLQSISALKLYMVAEPRFIFQGFDSNIFDNLVEIGWHKSEARLLIWSAQFIFPRHHKLEHALF